MSHFATSVLAALLVLLTICSANLATGRASLRPSAGKRSYSVDMLSSSLPRTPAFYRLVAEQECSTTTQLLLAERLVLLQSHVEHISQLLELCQGP